MDDVVKRANTLVEAVKVLSVGPSDVLVVQIDPGAADEALDAAIPVLRDALERAGFPPERTIISAGVDFQVLRGAVEDDA